MFRRRLRPPSPAISPTPHSTPVRSRRPCAATVRYAIGCLALSSLLVGCSTATVEHALPAGRLLSFHWVPNLWKLPIGAWYQRGAIALTASVTSDVAVSPRQALQRLLQEGYLATDSLAGLLNQLPFDQVFTGLTAGELIDLLLADGRITSYQTRSELVADAARRHFDVSHLRPDGLLTALATASGGSILTHPEGGPQAMAAIAAKDALRAAYEADRGAFLDRLPLDTVLRIVESLPKTSAADPRARFYTYNWAATPRNSTTGACPLPPGINGDAGESGSQICEAMIFVPPTGDFGTGTLLAVAQKLKRETDRMPPGHRSARVVFHVVQDFDEGILDAVYPPGHPAAGQPTEFWLPWMDQWQRIVRDRAGRFFALYRSIGGQLDDLYIDIENKGMAANELGVRNPHFPAPPTGRTFSGTLLSDPRWPALAAELRVAGILDLTNIEDWYAGQDYRGIVWNAVNERRRAEAINWAVFEPLRWHFPEASFNNYGNFHHSVTLPYGTCTRYTDSCHTVGSLVGTLQSVNLYGYIRDQLLPGQTKKLVRVGRIATAEVIDGVMRVSLHPHAVDSLRADQLAVGDRVNLYFAGAINPPGCDPSALPNASGAPVAAVSIIGAGAKPYLGQGEYLVTSIDREANALTFAFDGNLPRVTLPNRSCTVKVATDELATGQLASPHPTYDLERAYTDGLGRLVMTFYRPWSNLYLGDDLVLRPVTPNSQVIDRAGQTIDISPYECVYTIAELPNRYTVVGKPQASPANPACANLPALDVHEFKNTPNEDTIWLSAWRSWNAFVSDLKQLRSMLATSTVPVRPWVQHKFVDEAKAGVDPGDENDDADVQRAEPYHYYEEGLLHILMGLEKGNVLQNWIWSQLDDVAPDAYAAGNAAVQRTLDEASRVFGFQDRRVLTLSHVQWDDDYVLSGVDAGGKRIWRFTPNSLKLGGTGVILSLAPARIQLAPGHVFTMTGARIHREPQPVSTWGYWLVEDNPDSLLTIPAETARRIIDDRPLTTVRHTAASDTPLVWPVGGERVVLFQAIDPTTTPTANGRAASEPLQIVGNYQDGMEFVRTAYDLGTRTGDVFGLRWRPTPAQVGVHTLQLLTAAGRPLTLTIAVH